MEKVEAPTEHLDSKLSDRKIYWQHALMTFEPYGQKIRFIFMPHSLLILISLQRIYLNETLNH